MAFFRTSDGSLRTPHWMEWTPLGITSSLDDRNVFKYHMDCSGLFCQSPDLRPSPFEKERSPFGLELRPSPSIVVLGHSVSACLNENRSVLCASEDETCEVNRGMPHSRNQLRSAGWQVARADGELGATGERDRSLLRRR